MSKAIMISGITACFSKAGLGIGGTASGVSTANPAGAGIEYAIDGVAYYKVDDATTPITAAAAQAANTTCLYLIQVDSAGVVSSVKGNEVLTAELGVNGSCQIPGAEADKCAIGYIKVVTVGVTFTAGTTDLDASGVTTTYVDFMGGYPSSPVTS